MLEQPPEKSDSEIEAEFAAAAQTSSQLRPHGCFQLLVWCMPTFIFWISAAAAIFLHVMVFNLQSAITSYCVFLAFVMTVNYGIGILDGTIPRSNIAASAELRKQEILFHAASFTAMQVFVIPALTFLLIGGWKVLTTFI